MSDVLDEYVRLLKAADRRANEAEAELAAEHTSHAETRAALEEARRDAERCHSMYRGSSDARLDDENAMRKALHLPPKPAAAWTHRFSWEPRPKADSEGG